MFCFRVRKQLIPYIEMTLDERKSEAIAEHLEKCSHCSDELAFLTKAGTAFREAKTPAKEPITDLWARIERQISTTAPSPAPRRLFPMPLKLAGASLAVAVVVIAGASLLNQGSVRPDRHETTAQLGNRSAIRLAKAPETPVDTLQAAKPSSEAQDSTIKFPAHTKEVVLPSPRTFSGSYSKATLDRSVGIGRKPSKTDVASGENATGHKVYQIASSQIDEPRTLVKSEVTRDGAITEKASDAVSFSAVAPPDPKEMQLMGSRPGPSGPSGPAVAASVPSADKASDNLTLRNCNKTVADSSVSFGAPAPSDYTFAAKPDTSAVAVLANRRFASAHARELPKTSVDILNLMDEDSQNSAVFCY